MNLTYQYENGACSPEMGHRILKSADPWTIRNAPFRLFG